MESLFIFLTNLSSNSAYLIILAILIACGLGFPLPEDIPLIATGYLIWDGTMEWGLALGVTLLGVIIGDTMLFYLGRRLGLKVLANPKFQTLFKPRKVKRVRAYFRKYGDKIVFYARFVAGFRAVAFFMAGAMKMRYRRFIALDTFAAILSVPIWIMIGYGFGYYLGDEISQILLRMKEVKTGVTVLIFSIVIVVGVRAFMKYRAASKSGPRQRRLAMAKQQQQSPPV